MGSGYASHQSDREDHDVLLAISKSVARTRQGAFEQAEISNEVMLAGIREFEAIVLDDDLYREPDRLIRQGAFGFLDSARCARGLAPPNRPRP